MATGNPFTSAQAQPSQATQLISPEIAAQQSQLARQQQLAGILRDQSLTPMGDTQTIGGWAIKRSPWESVSKLGQALAATYMQSTADEKQLALSKQLQERMGDILGGNNPSQDPARTALAQGAFAQPSLPDDTGALVNQGGVGPTVQNATRMDSIPQAATNNFTMGNLLKGQVIGDIGGQAAGAAYWDQFKPTDGMKTDRYLGITPDQSRASELAKRLKEGTMSLQPGQTNIMPNGSRVIAPNFETGIAGGFDANGNPVANEIPGSTVIAAGRAGAIAAATSGANAANEMVTVNTATGPVMMTRAQAVQQSGGAQPAPPAPAPAPVGAPGLNNMTPQQRADLMSKAQAQFGLQPGATPGASVQGAPTPAPSGQVGIPLKTPAQEAQELAEVQLRNAPRLAQSTKEATDMADYGKALNGHLSDSQALLQRIAQSREALSKFQAGGGAEARSQAAQWAQAIPGMPTSLVDKIAGGDLSASQEFQKYAAQEAIETMQQSLASDTGKGSQGNRIAMQVFFKNNPNIDTDPRAIEKIFNFQTKQHNQLKAQADAYQQYKDTPGNNPANFPNYWASEAIKRGFVNPEIKSGYAKGVAVPSGWTVEKH